MDVSLFWEPHDGVDTVIVRVHDRETGASFEIAAEPHLALEIYYPPVCLPEPCPSTAKRDGGARKPQEGRRGRRSRGGFIVGGAES